MFGYRPRLPPANCSIGLHQNDFIMPLVQKDRARFSESNGERIFEPIRGGRCASSRLPEAFAADSSKRRAVDRHRWSTQKESSPRLRARIALWHRRKQAFGFSSDWRVQGFAHSKEGHREESLFFCTTDLKAHPEIMAKPGASGFESIKDRIIDMGGHFSSGREISKAGTRICRWRVSPLRASRS